jgi:D-alanyl-D-alanine carboxypeptidase (penicillin-binding protein 5/6)
VRARLVGAALAGVVLAAAGPAVPADATAAVSDRSSAAAIAAPPVPCPAPVQATRPPRPPMPPGDPQLRTVGGAALATSGLVVPPGSPRPPAVTATSWLVADLDTGAVLGGCGPHEVGTPASVQKLLLVATVLARLDPQQVVTVTRKDLEFEPGSSAVGLLVGGRYRVETLWLGLLLNSGNDAANVLARVGGGDAGLPGTMREMNQQAHRLGAFQTRAVTPSGLDAPGQVTSAYDLALIARACFAQDAFRRYVATDRTQVPAQPPADVKGFQIQNQNQFLYRYPGALGGKTGFTTLARHTFVGAAQRNGRRLVVTLLGAEARPLRGWQQGAALLDWGFALPRDASVGRLVAPGEVTPTHSAPSGRAGFGGSSVASADDPAQPWWAGDWIVAAVAVALAATAMTPVISIRRRRRTRRGGRR